MEQLAALDLALSELSLSIGKVREAMDDIKRLHAKASTEQVVEQVEAAITLPPAAITIIPDADPIPEPGPIPGPTPIKEPVEAVEDQACTGDEMHKLNRRMVSLSTNEDNGYARVFSVLEANGVQSITDIGQSQAALNAINHALDQEFTNV